ncbi:amino acid ABC transporter permease [Leucothrix arctica]|uniref:Amino acid ABC transporter permease n=1 Tax=Leucothrix arctica TaxID=1481894 RepID=A0A317CHD0_9GAMM|nr:amino acid ABC transporter permease [Leucothrix arctica]PWQ96813.1 amino acid ABC transporter permease [Leucothrix arctica]
MFDFRFYEIWRSEEFVQVLFEGAFNSFWLTTVGGIFGFILGTGLALLQDKSVFVGLRLLARSYVEIIRNTPFVVQMFFVAFGLPILLDMQWSFFASALLAIMLNFSAYFSEIIRSGIDSTPKGQIEAAYSLGFKKYDLVKDIILPQALEKVYPSLVSQFVFLFLTTGLISEIGIEDITWAGRFISDRNFRDFEVYLVLSAIYMSMSWMFILILNGCRRKLFPWRAEK